MKVLFLGTGTSQGVPVIACRCAVCNSLDYKDNRLRSSIYIDTNKVRLIIDTGPDFRQQVLRERITALDAIFFTHAHKDHTAGMDDIRGFNFHQQSEMPIYATVEVLHQLKTEFAYVFAEHKYPGIPQVRVNQISNVPFQIQDETIIPIEVLHQRLPVLGFRIQDFTYITDANFISNEERDKIRSSKILVINGLQREAHLSHFTLDEALEVIADIQPEKAYLTHISHKLGLHKEVNKSLPDNVELAYDGLQLSL